MRSRNNIYISAALFFICAPALFAGPVTYREAAALWNGRQAVELTLELTPAFLKEVKAERGPAAAAALAEKRERVSALVERFKACALRAEDLASAEKYFLPEFKAEVRYFAGEGCAAFKAAAAAPAAPASASAENLAAAGSLNTGAASARFFDGASARGEAAPAVSGAAGRAAAAAPSSAPAAARSSKPLASRVPLPPSVRASMTAPERPADLGKDGRVHQAMAYWAALRKEGWSAYKGGELTGAAKAKALAKAAAGAGFYGLLYFSNLDNVETAAARLGWDVGVGAGAGVIAADAAKLVFHSAVFAMMLAPIPLSKVAKAAVAGEPWAIAFVGAMAAGPVNRYILHWAD